MKKAKNLFLFLLFSLVCQWSGLADPPSSPQPIPKQPNTNINNPNNTQASNPNAQSETPPPLRKAVVGPGPSVMR